MGMATGYPIGSRLQPRDESHDLRNTCSMQSAFGTVLWIVCGLGIVAAFVALAGSYPRARLLLAKDSLPSGGSIGYEIFDRGDGFTSNEFQQNLNQLRALEGELARTIRTINGVRAARVHLVLPERALFSRDKAEASASI